jgi:hypothetical protein
MGLGSEIRVPGVKKAPDPGSTTLVFSTAFLRQYRQFSVWLPLGTIVVFCTAFLRHRTDDFPYCYPRCFRPVRSGGVGGSYNYLLRKTAKTFMGTGTYLLIKHRLSMQ